MLQWRTQGAQGARAPQDEKKKKNWKFPDDIIKRFKTSETNPRSHQ
jgi:hypothetical protein